MNFTSQPTKVLGKAQSSEGEMRGQRELINVKPRQGPKKSPLPPKMKKKPKVPKQMPKRVIPRPQRPNGSRSSLRRGQEDEVTETVLPKKKMSPVLLYAGGAVIIAMGLEL